MLRVHTVPGIEMRSGSRKWIFVISGTLASFMDMETEKLFAAGRTAGGKSDNMDSKQCAGGKRVKHSNTVYSRKEAAAVNFGKSRRSDGQ